jgi:uncharacterized membrane protein YvlD (DUF360 family)
MYLLNAIITAKNLLGTPSIFCHNITCAMRAIGPSPNLNFSIFFTLTALIYFAYYGFKCTLIKHKKSRFYALLLVASISTLIINDPSPDYRLIWITPFLLAAGKLINIEKLGDTRYIILVLCSAFILSFINIYINNFMSLTTIARFIGVMGFFHIIINTLILENKTG